MKDQEKSSNSEVVLINVFTPKHGKAEEFARAQVEDFERYGEKLDGAYENRLYISVNSGSKPRVINVAHFKDLEIFYRTTRSKEFKQHIETIRPLLAEGEPLLCQLIWQSQDRQTNDVETALGDWLPRQVARNEALAEEFGERRLPKSA